MGIMDHELCIILHAHLVGRYRNDGSHACRNAIHMRMDIGFCRENGRYDRQPLRDTSPVTVYKDVDGVSLLIQIRNIIGHPVSVHVTAYHTIHPYGSFALFLVFYKFISHFIFRVTVIC